MSQSEATMPEGHRWKPITDLPDDWRRLADEELASLSRVWLDQRGRLEEGEALQRFNERLRREWAIETGIIERLYNIDRGVTQMLIEHGIDASLISHCDTDRPAEEVVALVRDQQHAVEGLFEFVANRRELSTSYIKQLHQVLTDHQETTEARDSQGKLVHVGLTRGDWKKWPNNPTRDDGSVHEYCPPEQVASEMDRLIEMYLRHEAMCVPPEIEAAWLHHRFTQIHPFQDGNGRIARCLATLVFLRAGWLPLVVRRDDRLEYIEALEAADEGDLSKLVMLFAKIERGAFLNALGISAEVTAAAGAEEVIAAAIGKLERRKRESELKLNHVVFALLVPLELHTSERLQAVETELGPVLKGVDEGFWVGWHHGRHPDDPGTMWPDLIVRGAEQLGYVADLDVYHCWDDVSIQTGRYTDIVVSFHALGHEFSGVVAVSVIVIRWDYEQVGPHLRDWTIACSRAFVVNYTDEPGPLQARFETWLAESLVIALDQWRRWL